MPPAPHACTRADTVMTTGLRALTEGSEVLLSEQTRPRAASAFHLVVMSHYCPCLKPAPYPSCEGPSLPMRRGQPPTFMSSRLAGRAPGLPASAVLFCRASPPGPGVPELELLLVERLREGVGALLPGVSPAGLRQDRNKGLQYLPNLGRQWAPVKSFRHTGSYLGGAGRMAW